VGLSDTARLATFLVHMVRQLHSSCWQSTCCSQARDNAGPITLSLVFTIVKVSVSPTSPPLSLGSRNAYLVDSRSCCSTILLNATTSSWGRDLWGRVPCPRQGARVELGAAASVG
jgi:hypothetical protein